MTSDSYGMYLSSPLGRLLLACDGDAITGLWMQGQAHYPSSLPRRMEKADILEQARVWLERYFAGEDPCKTPLLRPEGTAFQRRVWAALSDIPYGATISYAALAAALEPPSSPRAVGAAVGRNPIALLIPCHRVVGAGGALTGYAGGVERKALLLALEQRGFPRLHFSQNQV